MQKIRDVQVMAASPGAGRASPQKERVVLPQQVEGVDEELIIPEYVEKQRPDIRRVPKEERDEILREYCSTQECGYCPLEEPCQGTTAHRLSCVHFSCPRCFSDL